VPCAVLLEHVLRALHLVHPASVICHRHCRHVCLSAALGCPAMTESAPGRPAALYYNLDGAPARGGRDNRVLLGLAESLGYL
jgi:hypothetical protein